jgi:pantothenate kinase-related protein Tda10
LNTNSYHTRAFARNSEPTQGPLLEAWRAVANAKLIEYRRQVWRLAALVRQGAIDKQTAIDRLWEIALAHALVRALGADRIEAIIAEAFADADDPAKDISRPIGDCCEHPL